MYTFLQMNKVKKRYRKKIEHQGNLLTQQRKLPKRNEGYKTVFIWNSKQTKKSKYENTIENVGIEGHDWLTTDNGPLFQTDSSKTNF